MVSPSPLEITNNSRYKKMTLWSADAGNCNQLYNIAYVIARFKGYFVQFIEPRHIEMIYFNLCNDAALVPRARRACEM